MSGSSSEFDPNGLHAWDHRIEPLFEGLPTRGIVTKEEWWHNQDLDPSTSVAVGSGVHGKAFAARDPSGGYVVAKVVPLQVGYQRSGQHRTSIPDLSRELFVHELLNGVPGFTTFYDCSIVIGQQPQPAHPPSAAPPIYLFDRMSLPLPAVHAVLTTGYAGCTVYDILHNDLHVNNILFQGPMPSGAQASVIDYAKKIRLVDYGRSGAEFDGQREYYDFSAHAAKPSYNMYKELVYFEIQRMCWEDPPRDWSVYDPYIDTIFGLGLLPGLVARPIITRAMVDAIYDTPGMSGEPPLTWRPNPQQRQAAEVLMQGERILGRFFVRGRYSELESPAAMLASICQHTSLTEEDLRALDFH